MSRIPQIPHVGCAIASIIGHVRVAARGAIAHIICICVIRRFQQISVMVGPAPSQSTCCNPFFHISITTRKVVVVYQNGGISRRFVRRIHIFKHVFKVGSRNYPPLTGFVVRVNIARIANGINLILQHLRHLQIAFAAHSLGRLIVIHTNPISFATRLNLFKFPI